MPAIVFMAFHMTATGDLGWRLLFCAHLLSSSAVIGTALVAMILGHWYLVNAALSFDHLVKLCRALLIAVGVKFVISAIYFAIQYDVFRPVLFEFDGMMLGVRVGAGLLMVGAMSWMAYSCAKSKSNQSATGILYVVVMFSLVGELVSMYYTLNKMTPI